MAGDLYSGKHISVAVLLFVLKKQLYEIGPLSLEHM